MSRTIVITGASAGIGRATAHAFAQQGAQIALLARGKAGLQAATREVEELGGTALPIVTDMADADQVEKAAAKIERLLGPIDLWINNAMVTIFSPLTNITPEEFRRATEVTYLGTVYGTMAALKRMLPRDSGQIIQVGSALAYRAIPLQSAYCGAKFAIRGFTDSLRSELLHDKSHIRLTMVQLPAHNTPQFLWSRTHLRKHPQPVPPIYQPEVAARAIVWAADHPRREVKVGWPTLQAIWGNKFFPSFGDRYLAKAGYKGQLMDKGIRPNRPDNLFKPLDGTKDFGAHGAFDKRSHERSVEWEISSRRRRLGAMVIAGIATSMLAWQRIRR